jgi:5-hydroxyisourate hydrolase
MSVSTHVLDTSTGRPAAGVRVALEALDRQAGWRRLGEGATGDDGRIAGLAAEGRLLAGTYRLVFETGAWFAGRGVDTFYPEVSVVFEVSDPSQHVHVPLLLSPFGYSTYRGS